MKGPIIAAALNASDRYSEKDRREWGGLTHQCVSCERETLEQLTDGWCWQCLHPGEDPQTPKERKAAMKALYYSTAEMLVRLGYPDRAQWYRDALMSGRFD